MTRLSNIIDNLNSEIIKGASVLTVNISGLTRRVEQNKQMLNYDSKQNIICFENSVDLNVYHRKIDSSSAVLQEKGKAKLYSITAKMELICYSKIENSQDYLINIISNVKDLEFTATDDDSVKIFKDEVGQDKFDPIHYAFKIFYTIKYQSNNCDTCLNNCNDTKE